MLVLNVCVRAYHLPAYHLSLSNAVRHCRVFLTYHKRPWGPVSSRALPGITSRPVPKAHLTGPGLSHRARLLRGKPQPTHRLTELLCSWELRILCSLRKELPERLGQ